MVLNDEGGGDGAGVLLNDAGSGGESSVDLLEVRDAGDGAGLYDGRREESVYE